MGINGKGISFFDSDLVVADRGVVSLPDSFKTNSVARACNIQNSWIKFLIYSERKNNHISVKFRQQARKHRILLAT